MTIGSNSETIPLRVVGLARMDEKDKAVVLGYLRALIQEVEQGEIKAVFCVYSYGPEGTGCFRGGEQDCALLGRIEHFKYRVVEGMDR